MCKCDPRKRTPFCGKGDCQWPKERDAQPETVMEAVVVPLRKQKSREERDVNGLIMVLLRIANDLHDGKAVETDFNIDITELKNYDMIDLKITTYHEKAK